MMVNIDEHLADESVESLPPLAWLFLALAFVPHLLALVGVDGLAMMASTVCFPASMGPLAFAHTYLLASRLGYNSHMAWISALLFSTIWSLLVCWFWRKNRVVALAIGAFCFIVSTSWIWLTLATPE